MKRSAPAALARAGVGACHDAQLIRSQCCSNRTRSAAGHPEQNECHQPTRALHRPAAATSCPRRARRHRTRPEVTATAASTWIVPGPPEHAGRRSRPACHSRPRPPSRARRRRSAAQPARTGRRGRGRGQRSGDRRRRRPHRVAAARVDPPGPGVAGRAPSASLLLNLHVGGAIAALALMFVSYAAVVALAGQLSARGGPDRDRRPARRGAAGPAAGLHRHLQLPGLRADGRRVRHQPLHPRAVRDQPGRGVPLRRAPSGPTIPSAYGPVFTVFSYLLAPLTIADERVRLQVDRGGRQPRAGRARVALRAAARHRPGQGGGARRPQPAAGDLRRRRRPQRPADAAGDGGRRLRHPRLARAGRRRAEHAGRSASSSPPAWCCRSRSPHGGRARGRAEGAAPAWRSVPAVGLAALAALSFGVFGSGSFRHAGDRHPEPERGRLAEHPGRHLDQAGPAHRRAHRRLRARRPRS